MQYWLLKSEPDAFSIDDLASRPNQTEPWNGVRNFQVRNWLKRSMKIGDLGFFYNSSCKIPGITGIVKIVREGYPDITALDPNSDYYDSKSTEEHPIWYCVDVQLVKKFKGIISLQELRQKPELKSMRILTKGNRLSITPVTKDEWDFIVAAANSNPVDSS